MDNRQLERLNSYIKSAEVLNDHTAAMDISLPEHAPYETQFDDLISQIILEAGLGTQDDTGVTIDQNQKRSEVEALHMKVANAAAAWYATQNNNGGLMRVKATLPKLQAMREGRFYIRTKQLVAIATPIAADLINAVLADVTALNTANEEYFELFTAPEQTRGKRKMHNAEVDPLLAEARDVRNTLTTLINTLAGTADNIIYVEWTASLSIDNTGPAAPPALTVEESILANAINNIDISGLIITGSTEIKLTNTGAVDLKFGFSTANNSLPGGAAVVSIGNNSRMTASALNYDAGTSIFLNVRNQTAGSGDYKLEVFIMD